MSSIIKLQKKMNKVWLKLLKACTKGNKDKQSKLQSKLVQLELEIKRLK